MWLGIMRFTQPLLTSMGMLKLVRTHNPWEEYSRAIASPLYLGTKPYQWDLSSYQTDQVEKKKIVYPS